MTQVQFSTISPALLAARLGSGQSYELVDVRTPQEYASAHVPGARLLPLQELDVTAVLAAHQPGTPIFVLCQSGARASLAIERFERSGCTDGVLVEGGTQAWMEAGLPLHHGERKVLPIMRQVQIVVGSLAALGATLSLFTSRWFAVIPLFLGGGLLFAGITGTCGMALLLAGMPWNQGQAACTRCCSQE